MPTNLLLAAGVSVILAMAPGAADGLASQPADAGPGINAEVRGVLRFEKSRSIYFIAVPPPTKGVQETRVWLLRGEDKDRDLDRKLVGLDGKGVTAKGKLAQMPENVQSEHVPSLGPYLDNHFTVEAAESK